MVKWLKSCYEAAVLWIDWHGRITTIVALIVLIGGTALVNRGAALWGQVNGLYLWIVSGLTFAVFLATIASTGRRMELSARKSQSIEIADQKPVTTSPKEERPPRLAIFGYRYPDVVLNRNLGIWRESNTEDRYPSKGLILKVSNDPYDDGKGVPACGLRVQLLWRYDNGVPGPNCSPAPWLNEPLGIINIPVGTTASLLVGTKSEHYWNGWTNSRISETGHLSYESEMVPDQGTVQLKMIGGTNVVWFEAYLKWEVELRGNHPRFRQITVAEATRLTGGEASDSLKGNEKRGGEVEDRRSTEQWKQFDLLLAHFQAISKSQSFFVNTLFTFLLLVWGLDLLHRAGGITIQLLGASIQIDGLWQIVPLVAGVLSLGLIGSLNLILPAWRRLNRHITEFFRQTSFFFTEFDPHRNILDYIGYLTLSLKKPVLPESSNGPYVGKQKWVPAVFLYPGLILFSIFTTSFTLRRIEVNWRSVGYVFFFTILQAVFSLPFIWRKACVFTGAHRDGYEGLDWGETVGNAGSSQANV